MIEVDEGHVRLFAALIHTPSNQIQRSMLGEELHKGIHLLHSLTRPAVLLIQDCQPQTGLFVHGLKLNQALIIST